MSDEDFKVDFIGIGASKCGTTWIFRCLQKHPEICGSSIKEPHFFSRPQNYQKGLSYYKSFFKHCPKEKIKGEFTPDYIQKKKAPQRIYKHFPETKIIASLRDPVERAYSHYRWAQIGKQRQGHYNTFKEAIDSSPVLLEKGLYGKQLERYFEKFPEQNILVLFFEDLKQNPAEFIRTVYKFLKLEQVDYKPDIIQKKENPTGGILYKQKFPFINSFLWNIWNKMNPPDDYGKLARFADKTGLRRIGKKILNFNRAKKKEKVEKKSTSLEDIKPDTRSYLRDFYREDISKLEQLIGKDLTHWKNVR